MGEHARRAAPLMLAPTLSIGTSLMVTLIAMRRHHEAASYFRWHQEHEHS